MLTILLALGERGDSSSQKYKRLSSARSQFFLVLHFLAQRVLATCTSTAQLLNDSKGHQIVSTAFICRMIESGDIFAEIDDQQGMVRFLEDAHSSDSPALMAELDSQIAQSIKLAERVRQLNYEVCPPARNAMTPAFFSHDSMRQ